MSFSYRDLKVWQRSIGLCTGIYGLTRDFPAEETYGLSAQLRRASVSVASNIAEGYGRGNRGDFRRFLAIARGSILELQTQLLIANALGYGKKMNLQEVQETAEEVGKMLWALMQKHSAGRTASASDF